MENQEKPVDDNWLNEEWIQCPSCHQALFRIDTSPFDDNYHFYCDRCPVRREVSFYDPHLDQLERALPESEEHYTELVKMVEKHLKPCACGGMFRYDAPRRCFFCYAPVIIDDPMYVDLYLNEDGFSQDPASQESFRKWQVRFCPDVEDIWKSLSKPEL